MIGIVVAMHGELSEALVNTAQHVVRDAEIRIVAVGIRPGDDAAAFETRLTEAIQKVQSPQGVLILTDMFGGTPSNVGMTLHRPGEIEVLTGANLPMLIKALQVAKADVSLMLAARLVKDAGARAITVGTDVLSGSTKESVG